MSSTGHVHDLTPAQRDIGYSPKVGVRASVVGAIHSMNLASKAIVPT